MRKLLFFGIICIFLGSMTSCSSTKNLKTQESELAGYTLKNKKELMQQKIFQKKTKSVIAIP